MTPIDREERLAHLAALPRVWNYTHGENVTPGLIQLCRDWITDDMDIAEVGCYAGVSTSVFACFARSVLAVDPWSMAIGTGYTQTYPEMLKDAEKRFMKVCEEYPNIHRVQAFSVDAAEAVEDGRLDAVYLDGDHRPEHVRADIAAWLPKIKPGGFLMGHDAGVLHEGNTPIGLPEADRLYPETSWVIKVDRIREYRRGLKDAA